MAHVFFFGPDSSIKAAVVLSLAGWQLMFPRQCESALANDKKRRSRAKIIPAQRDEGAGAKEFWQRRPNYTQEVEVIMRQLFLTNTRSLSLSRGWERTRTHASSPVKGSGSDHISK
jgi:hypothetical protein